MQFLTILVQSQFHPPQVVFGIRPPFGVVGSFRETMETPDALQNAIGLNGLRVKPHQLRALLKVLQASGDRRANFGFACTAMGIVGGDRTYKTLRQLETK